VIISCERPLADSIASIQSRCKHKDKADLAKLQTELYNQREAFIAKHPKVPVYRADYYRLLDNPPEEIAKISRFLEQHTHFQGPESLDDAIKAIKPNACHVRNKVRA
jgi:hypothetical protein